MCGGGGGSRKFGEVEREGGVGSSWWHGMECLNCVRNCTFQSFILSSYGGTGPH